MTRLDPQTLRQNRLLSYLPDSTLQSLAPHSKMFSFERGDILMHAGEQITHCYFPTNGIVSLVSSTDSGDCVEIAYVGVEGFVGFLILFRKDKMLYQALAQSGTKCIGIEAKAIIDLFERSKHFREAMLRFSYLIIRQFTQTCVCNHFHTLDSRICRWLCVMCERGSSLRLELTQEFLALMLGVQRTSIGPVTATLERSGVIRNRRGVIEILDYETMKQMACDCYSIVSDEQEQFFNELSQRSAIAGQ